MFKRLMIIALLMSNISSQANQELHVLAHGALSKLTCNVEGKDELLARPFAGGVGGIWVKPFNFENLGIEVSRIRFFMDKRSNNENFYSKNKASSLKVILRLRLIPYMNQIFGYDMEYNNFYAAFGMNFNKFELKQYSKDTNQLIESGETSLGSPAFLIGGGYEYRFMNRGIIDIQGGMLLSVDPTLNTTFMIKIGVGGQLI